MIYDCLRVTAARDTELSLRVIMFRSSIQDGTTFLLSMSKIPSDDVLEGLYKLRIRESDQLKTVLELYYMEIHQKISMPNFQKLRTMVERRINLRVRNFDARHGKIETGAVVKSRRGSGGIERGQGECYQWREKGQCSNGDQCSFRHERNDRAKPTPKTAPPSEPPTPKTRGRSASRKKKRQRSQSGKFIRQPCKYIWKGTRTESPCEFWHPPECQVCMCESGCKFGAECLFPHWKVEEQTKSRKRVMTIVQ